MRSCRLVLFALFTLVVPSYAQAQWLQECQRILGQFARKFTADYRNGLDDFHLSVAENKTLKDWAAKHSHRYAGSPVWLLDEHVALLLSELPAGIRQKLFLRDGVPLGAQQIFNRIEAAGINRKSRDALDRISLSIGSSDRVWAKKTYEEWEARIARISSLPPESIEMLYEEIRIRQDIGEIVARLSEPRLPQYEIEVREDVIIVPDALREDGSLPIKGVYPIRRRLADGTLLVEMPTNLVLSTQDKILRFKISPLF